MILDVLGCIAHLIELRHSRSRVTPFVNETALGPAHSLLQPIIR
jgi:hypothetical protein